jgi:hypothetical protein
MSELKPSSLCGSCGQSVEETPCPHCGSILRAIHVSVQETIGIREKLSLKGRENGKRRPVLEQVHGDDLQHKTGIWMKRSRVIDRKNDLYHETVKNPETGEVVHECKEPLSEHRGHGAAKKKV